MENFIYCYKNLNTLYVDIRANFYFLKAILENKNEINKIKIDDEFIGVYNEINLSFGTTTSISAYLNILQSSFLDEYKNHFKFQKYSDKKLSTRIQRIENFNQPLLDIINQKWPDIKNFRNNCSAHNLRIKIDKNNYKSIFQQENILDYKIPYYFVEHRLFFEIIEIIINNIYFEFKSEINDYKNIINLKITDKINFIRQKTKDEDFEEIKTHKHY